MIQRNPTLKFDLTFPSAQPKVYQRLGEKQATDIIVQVFNDGKPFSLTGVRFGFELRNDRAKIIIDTNQTHFSVIDNAKGIFRYRVTDEGFGYIGNSYLAYFTFAISDVRITTERFRFHNDEDVQIGAEGLQEHYVSVIDNLVKSNKQALEEAEKIKAMIEANQVVKKTGDTMTGDLSIDKAGATNKKYIFKKDGVETFNLYNYSDTHVGLRDSINNKNIWEYNRGTGSFDILAGINTNIVKKSEIYSDWILPGGTPKAVPNGVDMNTITESGVWQANGNPNLPTTDGQWYIVEVFKHTQSFVIQRATRFAGASPDVYVRTSRSGTFDPWRKIPFLDEVLKKTGDTMTGHLGVDGGLTFRGSGATYDQRPYKGTVFSKGFRHTVNTVGNYYAVAPVDENGSANWNNQLRFDGDTGKLTVREFATLKDGRANLTLTADATNANAGYVPMAIRKGNAVTVRMEVTRNVGSSGTVITTLPPDMKPTDTLSYSFISNDGTAVSVNIKWDGNIEMYTTGKQTKIVATYVVD